MTKAEIIQTLYARVGGLSKKELADHVDLVFDLIKEALGRGQKVKICGFGNFVPRDKRRRSGRNPQDGSPIQISERRVLAFKPSEVLRGALNTNGLRPSAPLEPNAIEPASPAPLATSVSPSMNAPYNNIASAASATSRTESTTSFPRESRDTRHELSEGRRLFAPDANLAARSFDASPASPASSATVGGARPFAGSPSVSGTTSGSPRAPLATR